MDSEPTETIRTPLTDLFGIKYPILLAGMNKAAGPKLAAAVTNAGGLGVIGGIFYTPRILRKMIQLLKKDLIDPNLPFGVDLALPQVGGSARKTNYDYTKGQLDELIDVIIEEGSSLFVSAIGVPPEHVVTKLHDAGVLVMNMIGAPKHVPKALAAGVDLLCAQGGEGGGHTGDVPTSILIPAAVDLCRGRKSPLTGQPIYVVGAGGIHDGRSLVMALSLGAEAVWVGTRFVACEESGASEEHKQAVLDAGYHDTYRTLVYSGRPMRIIKNDYVDGWHAREEEMKELLNQGITPIKHDQKTLAQKTLKKNLATPLLSGQVAGRITRIVPARVIVNEMMNEAILTLKQSYGRISKISKL